MSKNKNLSDVKWNYIGRAKVGDWYNPRSIAISGDMVKLTVNACCGSCNICRSRFNHVNHVVGDKKHAWLNHSEIVFYGYDGNVAPQTFLSKALGLQVVL